MFADNHPFSGYYDINPPYDSLAAHHIDVLTYNRIDDYRLLTPRQKTVVEEVYTELAKFEQENAEILNSPLKSYSVNGVSMSFGGEGIKVVSGVIIPSNLYALLVTTGLCYPAI